ncbi:hypothetical protein ACMU_17995 [Actibacterium mucosum KCTC 23349]|uniref:Uncharacterized protein n=2 Tax=Actibacterium TaxID=1433986 RepID=A0A037ZG51_9RHOB|nr:hypothetical protein ACMU_17995 [Actibacterium mucosum KCTC 23349]
MANDRKMPFENFTIGYRSARCLLARQNRFPGTSWYSRLLECTARLPRDITQLKTVSFMD